MVWGKCLRVLRLGRPGVDNKKGKSKGKDFHAEGAVRSAKDAMEEPQSNAVVACARLGLG